MSWAQYAAASEGEVEIGARMAPDVTHFDPCARGGCTGRAPLIEWLLTLWDVSRLQPWVQRSPPPPRPAASLSPAEIHSSLQSSSHTR